MWSKLQKLRCAISLFLCLSFYLCTGFGEQNIRLLTWWDYTPEHVKSYALTKGWKINEDVYKSNDVAISKIVNQEHSFDIAILSSQAIPVLLKQGKIDPTLLVGINSSRKYLEFLNVGNVCVPYLWSGTVYASNRIYGVAPSAEINTMEGLFELNKNKTKIGIIDDKAELFARIYCDKFVCNESVSNFSDDFFTKVMNQKKVFYRFIKDKLRANQFSSGFETVLNKENSAAYGWHGAMAALLEANPDLQLIPPKSSPVIGYDAVCILNNKKSKLSDKQKIEFVKLLTSKKVTDINVKQLQYFSPYKNHTSFLHRKTKKLHDSLLKFIKKGDFIIIPPPSVDAHKKLNLLWREVRY